MCLRFVFLLITRVASWLRLSRREEAWQAAEILILRHQLGAPELPIFASQLGDPPRFLRRGTRPDPTVNFRLPHRRPPRLRMNTQLPRHPRKLAPALPVPLTNLEHHLMGT